MEQNNSAESVEAASRSLVADLQRTKVPQATKAYVATPIFCITDGSMQEKIVGVMQGAQIGLGPTHTMQDLEREVGKQYRTLAETVQTPIMYKSIVISRFDDARSSLLDLGLRLAT